MRRPELIQEHIRHLDRLNNVTVNAVKEDPEHYGLQLLMRQNAYQKEKLVAELRESIRHHHSHVLSYIFKTKPREAMKLDTMLSGLAGLRDLVKQAYYGISGKELPLNFETVFQSSFGVMLSTPPDGELLQSKYSTALQDVVQTIQKIGHEEADIKQIINKKFHGNRKAAKRYADLFKNIHESGCPVEIIWTNIIGDTEEVAISVNQAKFIHGVFLEHGKKEPYEETVRGSIKGISLLDNTIQFKRSDTSSKKDQVIKARFPDELASKAKSLFDKTVEATFYIEIEYVEATDQEKAIKTLICLNNTDGNQEI